MNKPARSLSFLIFAAIFLFVLQGCNQADTPAAAGASSPATNRQVAELVKKGDALQGLTVDSIVPVIAQLKQINAQTGSRNALLQAEIFDAHYNWLKASHAVAMQKALKALADAEKWNIPKSLPKIYSIISNLHKESGNYDQAFSAINKGIAAARLNKDTADIIMTLANKAMYTHSYYNFSNKIKDDTISLGLQLSALKMAEASPQYESKRIQFYNNIAQTYKERKAYDEALFYGDKAVVLAKKYHRQRSLTYSYCWLGESYFYMGQQQKGLNYLNQALVITKQIKEPYRRMELNETIYWCYRSINNDKLALQAYINYRELKDSLEVSMSSRQLNELQLKYDAVKKDKQIAALSQLNKLNRRNVIFITLSAFVFLILFILIMFQYFIIRKNNHLIAAKNSGLNEAMLKIAFIQSHEIRKPLATLLGIINLVKEDDYQADPEVLKMIETSANSLDTKIREIIEVVEKNN